MNVGTLRCRAGKVVEMLSRRRVDVSCVQETRWKSESARLICGKDDRYKLY